MCFKSKFRVKCMATFLYLLSSTCLLHAQDLSDTNDMKINDGQTIDKKSKNENDQTKKELHFKLDKSKFNSEEEHISYAIGLGIAKSIQNTIEEHVNNNKIYDATRFPETKSLHKEKVRQAILDAMQDYLKDDSNNKNYTKLSDEQLKAAIKEYEFLVKNYRLYLQRKRLERASLAGKLACERFKEKPYLKDISLLESEDADPKQCINMFYKAKQSPRKKVKPKNVEVEDNSNVLVEIGLQAIFLDEKDKLHFQDIGVDPNKKNKIDNSEIGPREIQKKTFNISRVTTGIKRAIKSLKIGERAIFLIPSSLMFGDASGTVPPRTSFIADITLLDVVPNSEDNNHKAENIDTSTNNKDKKYKESK